MGPEMSKDEILELFERESETLGNAYQREQDTIDQLAVLLATVSSRITQEEFDSVLQIGATLCRKANMRAQARADIALTMQESRTSRS